MILLSKRTKISESSTLMIWIEAGEKVSAIKIETNFDAFTGESHNLLMRLPRFELQGHDGLTGNYKSWRQALTVNTSTTIFTVINSSLRSDGHNPGGRGSQTCKVISISASATRKSLQKYKREIYLEFGLTFDII